MTPKQLEANRLNALKSTGPRTDAGKRVSSQNALKSGLDAESQILPGESPEAFAQLQAEYLERFRPATPDARFQVDNLIRSEWLIRRYHRVEAQLWQYHASHADPNISHALGAAWAKADAQFMRLHRRVAAAEKAYAAAQAALERLQAAPQPEETTQESPQMASFRTDPGERSEPVVPHLQPPSPTPVSSPVLKSEKPAND